MGRNSLQQAAIGELLERGVWSAPWIGPNGELVLLAVTEASKLAAPPYIVPDGASRIDAADLMWDEIEAHERRRSSLHLI